MRKYRSYIFLGLLLIVFLTLGYFFLGGKTKKVEIVEINFVSDHAIVSNSNEMIPEFITTFAACYIENDSIDYISRISFKRIDTNDNDADSLSYAKARIDKNLTINMAQEIFANENKSLKSTKQMSKPDLGFKSGYKDDTLNKRYFYLVGKNDPKVNLYPTIYFNSHEKLKEHINQELKSGTLFKGKKENKVTIILLKGTTTSPVPKPGPESVPPGGGDTNIEPIKIKDPAYDPKIENGPVLNPRPDVKRFTINTSFIELKQNTMSWSDDLKKYATSIKITYSNGKKTLEYDVTGAKQHVFNSGDKAFDAVAVKVNLIIELPSNISLKGKTQQIIYPICEL